MSKFVTIMLIAAVALMMAAPPVFAQTYIELDPMVVEGRIQRPEAAYIIQRAQLEFGMQAKKRSFLFKIEESIDGAPF